MSLNANTAINTGQVPIQTTATLLAAGRNRRSRIFITNLDTANPIFIGSTNAVTAATGYRISPGLEKILEYQGDVYAIATGAIVNVAYLEEFGTL